MKVLISLLFLLIANAGLAEEMRYYDTEIIVVENLSPDAKISENWPLQVEFEQPEKIVELGQPVLIEWLPEEVDLTSSYVVLPPEEFQLIEEAKNISESKTHRIIFHTAWRQPGLDKNQSIPIHFKQEVTDPNQDIDVENQDTDVQNQYSAEPIQENADHTIIGNTFMPVNELGPIQKSNIAPSILEGILRITLSRYLHLEAEITYKKSEPNAYEGESEFESSNPFAQLYLEAKQEEIKEKGIVYLKQNRRRIRSNELHYIDHPILGVFVRITRYEKPEEPEEPVLTQPIDSVIPTGIIVKPIKEIKLAN